MVERQPITEKTVNLALDELRSMVQARIQQKGDGCFISLHELRGALEEKWDELREAFHKRNLEEVELELMGLLVGTFFGYACIRQGLYERRSRDTIP
jgi:hypothetical protein